MVSAGCTAGATAVDDAGTTDDAGQSTSILDGGDADGGEGATDGGCVGVPTAQSDATAGPTFMPPGAEPTWQDYDASFLLSVKVASTREVLCSAEVPNVGRTLFYRQSPLEPEATMSVFVGDSIEDDHEVSVQIAAPLDHDGAMVPEHWDATEVAQLSGLRVVCEVDEFAGDVFELNLGEEAVTASVSRWSLSNMARTAPTGCWGQTSVPTCVQRGGVVDVDLAFEIVDAAADLSAEVTLLGTVPIQTQVAYCPAP